MQVRPLLRTAVITALVTAFVAWGIPYLATSWRLGGPDQLVIIAWFFVAASAGGLGVCLKALIGRFRKSSDRDRAPRIAPEAFYGTSLRLRPHRTVPLMLDMPNFGMYWGWILVAPMAIFMIAHTPKMEYGFSVRLPSRYVAALPGGPGSESLGVYVRDGGRFYVNGRVVPRERLRATLEEELSRRVSWTVYFEADDNIDFRQAAYAIDTIQGLGAQVYWITPRVRQELNSGANPASQTLLPPAKR
jgi:biopolymer transport protein ExbD